MERKDLTGRVDIYGSNLGYEDGWNLLEDKVFDTLKQMKNSGMLPTSFELKLNFIDPTHEDYSEDSKTPHINVYMDDLHRMTEFKTLNDPIMKELHKLLVDSMYVWMNQEQFEEFSKSFMDRYMKLPNAESAIKTIYEFDPNDIDYSDIRQLLDYSCIGYTIRYVGSHYQVCPIHP